MDPLIPEQRAWPRWPALGAVVMSTAIVSVVLDLEHHGRLSRAVFALALVLWLALAVLLTLGLACERDRVRREARSPSSFTLIAATAVIATRLALAGWDGVAEVLLAGAAAAWLVLLVPVARHWTTPTSGVSFLPVVAIEALAVLASTLALRRHAGSLAAASFAPLLLGLVLYLCIAARFDRRQLVVGRGDHWIAGGALAISTLAAANITLAAHALGLGGGTAQALRDSVLALWLAAMLWLPLLAVAELLRPRLAYDIRRWSTVFPVAMYAASSIAVARLVDSTAIRDFAHAWTWVALGLWLTTAATEGRMVFARAQAGSRSQNPRSRSC